MKTTLLFSLLLAIATPAFAAAPAANRYAATIAPMETFASGVLAVEKHGSHGRPLILVPGLASGAWAWQSVVRDLSADYTIYVVTLPGFDGRPFPAGAGFDAARAGLRDLQRGAVSRGFFEQRDRAVVAAQRLDHRVGIAAQGRQRLQQVSAFQPHRGREA